MDFLDREIKTGPCAHMTGREKFWMYVAVSSDADCWEWTDDFWSNGYGRLSLFDKKHLAHRISYYIHYGVDPGELMVCHHCDNKRCVNPHHLFLGTALDNNRDRSKKGRSNPAYGSRGYRSFLAERQASEIKWLANHTPLMNQQIGYLYNIPNVNTVSRIKTGARWPHINPVPVENWENLLYELSN